MISFQEREDCLYHNLFAQRQEIFEWKAHGLQQVDSCGNDKVTAVNTAKFQNVSQPMESLKILKICKGFRVKEK